MNRPKITKQTLKELRGELFAKQNAQKQFNHEEARTSLEQPQETKEIESNIRQENEEEMDV